MSEDLGKLARGKGASLPDRPGAWHQPHEDYDVCVPESSESPRRYQSAQTAPEKEDEGLMLSAHLYRFRRCAYMPGKNGMPVLAFFGQHSAGPRQRRTGGKNRHGRMTKRCLCELPATSFCQRSSFLRSLR